MRPLARIRVTLRLALRFIVRYLTGRWTTVALPDRKKIAVASALRFVRSWIEMAQVRRKDNRDLLTGMIVALQHGKMVHPLTGWERYKSAARPRPCLSKKIPAKVIGWPVVYKSAKGVKVGMTEFHPDYVPRSEVLAARRRKVS